MIDCLGKNPLPPSTHQPSMPCTPAQRISALGRQAAHSHARGKDLGPSLLMRPGVKQQQACHVLTGFHSKLKTMVTTRWNHAWLALACSLVVRVRHRFCTHPWISVRLQIKLDIRNPFARGGGGGCHRCIACCSLCFMLQVQVGRQRLASGGLLGEGSVHHFFVTKLPRQMF